MTKTLTISFLIAIMFISSAFGEKMDKIQRDEIDMSKGRISIVLTTTAYSAGLYGWGIPYMFEPRSNKGRIYTGSEMVSTFGGFALSLLFTKNYQKGPVVAKMLQGGALVGTLYGLALPALFNPDEEKAYVGGAMLGTPIGALVGYRLAGQKGIDEGDAELITFGSIIGAGYGMAVPYLINISEMKDRDQARVYAGSAMAGIPAGALAFNELSRHTEINKGRARLIELGSCMGIYYGYNFVLMKDPGRARPYIAAMIAGMPIGTVSAFFLTREGEFSNARSMLIILGTILGDLSGRGFAYLFGAEKWRTLSIGAMIMTPVGTFTSAILTKNISSNPQGKTGYMDTDILPKLALLGASYLMSHNGREMPIYLEFYRSAF